MKYRTLALLLVAIFSYSTINAQKPKRWTSGEIHDAIKKLNFLGSALYVAAHPDDENTRLIAYLANDLKANVAYLSLTRGDGGQNLIGPEIREQLGVIRTQELLAARRIDGGNQMFSRANDFGFSKTVEETLEIWNEDEILSDVVWAIRKWQPDIIVNRFQHFEEERLYGRMHGHHTSSAKLSHQAFDLTAKEDVFPEQLKYVDPWQPRRLFFNTSWWFYGSQEAFNKTDKTNLVELNVGSYLPKIGKSVPEIAAESRSMHKSQGFGSTGSRGKTIEYLQLLKGDLPNSKKDLFAGINTTWTRVEGGAPIGKLLDEIIASFDFDRPAASVPQLLEVKKLIDALPDGHWKRIKSTEIKAVIKACMGLFVEVVAGDFSATPGDRIDLNMEVINRSGIDAAFTGFSIPVVSFDTSFTTELSFNEGVTLTKPITVPADIEYSSPYWLDEPGELGIYTVKDQKLRGLPVAKKPLVVHFSIDIMGETFDLSREVVFKRNDPVDGEVYRPFEVLPPVVVNLEEKVLLFGDNITKEAHLVVKAGKDNVKTTVSIELPAGWEMEPQQQVVELTFKGEEERVGFQITPPATQSEGYMKAFATINGHAYHQELVTISYDHIPTQTILMESKAKVVRVDLKRKGENIGYIMGAGDALPENLRQVGYQVTVLEENEINLDNLKSFDAIIMGVRAYNTIDRMKFYQPVLMDYVKEGGTMIVQYNTNRGLKISMEEIGPYPLTISRDRVTKEEAEVRFLSPDHPVLNFPNKITTEDFDDWVQERGLYFPNEWDDQYTAILSANDPTEPGRDGGLLVAEYGEGHYVYTGYSFFREFPAGVAGAYRLFANMIALGNSEKP